MSVRATISTSFLWRLALIAAVCLGMGLWFLYDGVIGYPRQAVRARHYKAFKDGERLHYWKDYAKSQGWPLGDPGEAKTQGDIYVQLIIAAVAIPPGLFYLALLVYYRGRWIEFDDPRLRGSGNRNLTCGDITELNKKHWKKKGIAKIYYEQDGRSKMFLLDDWKYAAAPTREILVGIEAHLRDEQIVMGTREPQPGENALGDKEGSEADGGNGDGTGAAGDEPGEDSEGGK